MNEYDSDKMADVLRQFEGYEKTDNQDEAAVILFNTCSIREKAQEKVFSDLGRARKLKLKNPDIIIGVGGCVASQEGDVIIQRAPYVDMVFGPQTLHRIPELIEERRRSGKSQVDISFPEIEKFDNMPMAKVEGSSAFVSIMEGCSKYCSYCVVPYTRGEELSRPFESVLTEIAQLTLQGVKEVNLLGQNVNAYRGLMSNGEIADFAMLLEFVHEIPGIERIRFTTSHPREMTQRIIDCYAKLPKLVSHLHLPVQSGSDRILGAMKRGYTVLEYKSVLRKVRAIRPDISFSSDFIVGFPGETEEDFQMLLDFLTIAQLEKVGCFKYSDVDGAGANQLKAHVSEDVKEERYHRFMQHQQTISLAKLQGKIGKIMPMIVDEVTRKVIIGRSKYDAPEIDGLIYIKNMGQYDQIQVGEIIDVEIIASKDYDLYAKPLLVHNTIM